MKKVKGYAHPLLVLDKQNLLVDPIAVLDEYHNNSSSMCGYCKELKENQSNINNRDHITIDMKDYAVNDSLQSAVIALLTNKNKYGRYVLFGLTLENINGSIEKHIIMQKVAEDSLLNVEAPESFKEIKAVHKYKGINGEIDWSICYGMLDRARFFNTMRGYINKDNRKYLDNQYEFSKDVYEANYYSIDPIVSYTMPIFNEYSSFMLVYIVEEGHVFIRAYNIFENMQIILTRV